MKTLIIGPLISAHSAHAFGNPRITPLGLKVEWAIAKRAVTIQLFRYQTQHAPCLLRIEHIVFPLAQLPFDLECSEYQVVETPLGIYLPVEALLSELYSKYPFGRSVFIVLAELAELLPLNGSVCRLVETQGFLIPEAEQTGFILTSVVRKDERVVAEIGWRPPRHEYVFHTCLCDFQSSLIESGDAGAWKPSSLIGIHQPLSQELRRLVTSSPNAIFTPVGRKLLQDRSSAHVIAAALG